MTKGVRGIANDIRERQLFEIADCYVDACDFCRDIFNDNYKTSILEKFYRTEKKKCDRGGIFLNHKNETQAMIKQNRNLLILLITASLLKIFLSVPDRIYPEGDCRKHGRTGAFDPVSYGKRNCRYFVAGRHQLL